MRSSVAFLLAVSLAMFGFGVSLQCYSCPGGSSSSCEVKQECNQAEDSCLKLTSGESTYTACLRYRYNEISSVKDRSAATIRAKTGFFSHVSKLCGLGRGTHYHCGPFSPRCWYKTTRMVHCQCNFFTQLHDRTRILMISMIIYLLGF